MKLTASSIRPHTRAMRCWVKPVLSKKDAINDSVPISIVSSTISGVVNSQERRKLIA